MVECFVIEEAHQLILNAKFVLFWILYLKVKRYFYFIFNSIITSVINDCIVTYTEFLQGEGAMPSMSFNDEIVL